MSQTPEEKIDLRAEVYAGITYRQIRDAFNRLGENFHPDTLGLAVWKDDIGKAYCRDTGTRSPKRGQVINPAMLPDDALKAS